MVRPRQILYDVNHLGFLQYHFKDKFFKHNNKSYLKYKKNFERSFLDFMGIKDLIPLSRARLGIYLYLKNIINAEKNEVIMSPFTIFDVVNMVISAGGKPVFVDVNSKNDLNLSKESIGNSINKKTCCVLITNYHTNYKNFNELIYLCKEKNIKILEDCAISFGTYCNNKHVGSYSDAAIFSFSLFKFISVYYGGALHIKDIEVRNLINKEIDNYDVLKSDEMLLNFFKGLKISFLTNKFVFPYIFRVFRFGFNKKITFIRNSAKNDPNPILREKIPQVYKKKPNIFQLKEFCRQVKKIKEYGDNRSLKFALYNQLLEIYPKKVINKSNSYLNYPIVFSTYDFKYKFIKFMMNAGFDLGEYYYRSCSKEPCFKKYHKHCPNSEHYSNCVVTLPTHHRVDEKYLIKLRNKAYTFIKQNPESIIFNN